MEKFVYYEIKGFLPASFIAHKVSGTTNFASREQAIEELENAINEWIDQPNFGKGMDFLDEVKVDLADGDYIHQIIAKSQRTGIVTETTFRVTKHCIYYNK